MIFNSFKTRFRFDIRLNSMGPAFISLPEPRSAKSFKLKLVDLDKARPAQALQRSCVWFRTPARCTIRSLTFITTILALSYPQHLAAQQVTREAPPARITLGSAETFPDLPRAVPLTPPDTGPPLTIESDIQERHGDLYSLSGDVVITYPGRTVRADRISYDTITGDLTVEGHVLVSGGLNDEYIQASRGSYNLNTQTGRFYDVSGSVGAHNTKGEADARHGQGYQSSNPFLFSGRLVVKTGPQAYDIYDGKVTSCLLPNPDWQLSAAHFSLDSDKARARNSTFRVLNLPIVFLPYVTHPIDTQTRQSGFFLPTIDPHSSTKGTVFTEEIYLAFGRSSDLTFGAQFFTLRGFSESGTFRNVGIGSNFFTAHFSALQDRGFTPAGGVFTNQGGQDVTVAFRHKLTSRTRVVGDAEYLSSYVYREAFNENFNQAVSSDITSIVYAVNQQHGFSTALRADRYQGLKRVPLNIVNKATGQITALPGQDVRIFHAPSLDFTALDHRLAGTPLLWSVDSSLTGLKRTQPNFVSSGIIQRLDFRPELALPLSGGGWHTLSSIAVHDTLYSRSRIAVQTLPPVELTQPVNRASVDMQIDIRPPAIERDFRAPQFLARLLGPDLRHTVEPEVVYRNVRGISNFLSILRFDDIDIASNTNELEYGVTQHLFARRHAPQPSKQCAATGQSANQPAEPQPESEAPSGLDANGIPTPQAPPVPQHTHTALADPCATPDPPQQEWLSWKLAQKHFFDSTFGGAVVNTRRNIFESTLSFSGIAFLTEPRDISPLVSRLRLRTSSHTDLEWDFDLDTGAKKFTSSNIFLDAHEGPIFGALSYARLNAPGRFFTETIDSNNVNTATLTSSLISDFSQLRVLLGYGTASKAGLSAAANANVDLKLGSLQYGAVQASYNWNCCGLSVEYRKYELGSVRNEGTERFSFTLLNIGTAGNLRKAQRLF